MKNSNIEWIGQIPNDWELVKIGSIYKSRNEKVNDTDYPPLSVAKIGIVPQMENVAKSDAKDNRKKVLKNDFVINSRSDRKQSCGVSIYNGSVSLINTVIYTNKVYPQYANYLLKNYGFAEEYYRWGHGIVADLWTTNWQEMKSIVLPLPSIKRQKEITNVMDGKCDKIDRLIDNENKAIEKLKEYKQAVITEAVTKGLDKSVPLKDSGIDWLGYIPNNYKLVKLKNITKLITDGTHQTPNYIDNGYPFLSIKDISSGVIDFSDTKFISEEEHKLLYKSTPVEKGDMIFTRIGTLGVFIIVDTDIVFDIFVSLGLIKFDDRITMIEKQYIKYYFSTINFFNYINLVKAGGGTAAAKFNLGSVKESVIAMPPINELHNIVDYLDKKCKDIDKLISLKQQKIDKLTEYKKSLIYEYVTGKKEV